MIWYEGRGKNGDNDYIEIAEKYEEYAYAAVISQGEWWRFKERRLSDWDTWGIKVD